MSALARELARLLWWYLLWLMRRPWMKRLHRRSLGLFGAKRRDRVWNAMKRQNRFARKWGLRMLIVTMNLVLASVLITITYLIAINLYEAGAFRAPGSNP